MRRKHKFWHIFRILLCTAVLFCGAVSYSGVAFAQDLPVTNVDDNTHYQGDLFCPNKYDGLSGRVVHCIQSLVVQAVKDFLNAFMPYYEAFVLSILILGVTIFGAMVLTGSVQKTVADSMMLLFKMGAIAFFTLQFTEHIDLIFGTMEGLLDVVTNYVTLTEASACSDSEYTKALFVMERDVITVWDKVDCMFMTLLGIGVTRAVASGIVAVLAVLIFTGGIGQIILIMAIYFILTLLFAVLRAMKMYLSAVIAIAFLLAVSPLVIPMAMFKNTFPYFKKWLTNLFNQMVIPIFLFAYISMMLAAYDAILFKGEYSLYYAIASEASQQEGFNFRDWVEVGASGQVSRYPDNHKDMPGQVIYNGSDPELVTGELVGKDVPGTYAVALIGYKKVCSCVWSGGCSPEQQKQVDLLGEICEKSEDELDQMLECAINPRVPNEGLVSDPPEKQACPEDGLNYYGFQMSDEILHYGIAPNRQTDADVRKAKQDKCSNLFCSIGRGLGKMVGAAFDFVKNVVGGIARVVGAVLDGLGQFISAVGKLVDNSCRFMRVPGLICDLTGGALIVSGNIIHATGSFVNFSGRILMNGLLAELGEMFHGWFDVLTLDFQKVASYHCKVEMNITDPKDERYLGRSETHPDRCPTVMDIIIKILYAIVTAAIVANLMLNWLKYVPSFAKQMVGGVSMDTDVPGEGAVQQAVQKVNHGLERMRGKSRWMKRR